MFRVERVKSLNVRIPIAAALLTAAFVTAIAPSAAADPILCVSEEYDPGLIETNPDDRLGKLLDGGPCVESPIDPCDPGFGLQEENGPYPGLHAINLQQGTFDVYVQGLIGDYLHAWLYICEHMVKP